MRTLGGNMIGGLGNLMCLILIEIYLKGLHSTFTFRIICLSKNDIYFRLTIYVVTL